MVKESLDFNRNSIKTHNCDNMIIPGGRTSDNRFTHFQLLIQFSCISTAFFLISWEPNAGNNFPSIESYSVARHLKTHFAYPE